MRWLISGLLLLLGMTLQVVDYFLSRSGVYYRNRWLYFSPLFSPEVLGRCCWPVCGRLADVPGPYGGRTCYWAWYKHCFARPSPRNFWARPGPGLVNSYCIARYMLRKRILPILCQRPKCWFLSCSSPHPLPIICNNQFRPDLQVLVGQRT